MGGKAEYDEHGNQVTTTYVGLDGKPTLLGSGVAIFRSAYNAEGKATRMSYHGVKGEPVLHRDGNHAWEVQYDERGNAHLDHLSLAWMESRPWWPRVMLRMKSTYDARGRKTRQSLLTGRMANRSCTRMATMPGNRSTTSAETKPGRPLSE